MTRSTGFQGGRWLLAPKYAALVGAVFLVAAAGPAQAGVNVWTTHGPYGGSRSVEALAIDPVTPSTLYAGTEGGGVFKSTDSGASWSAVNTGLPSGDLGPSVQALAIDPLTPSTLYAGGLADPFSGTRGMFKSTDGGASWTAINTGLTTINVRMLAIDPKTPSTLYAGTAYYNESMTVGVFQSTDGGASWSPVNTGLTEDLDVGTFAIDPLTPTTLYAGTYGSGVFKSTDSGGSWSAVNTGLGNLDVRALAIDPVTPSTLYAGTAGGVYRSTNNGGSWTAVNVGLGYCIVQALAIDPITPSTLYAGTDDGVYRSTDTGANWSAINTGLTNTYVWTLVIDPKTTNTIYAGIHGACGYGTGVGPCFAGGVFKSTDGGASWTGINNGFSSDLVGIKILSLLIDPATPSTLYADTQICDPWCGPVQVYQSTDSGGSWSALNTGLGDLIGVLAIDPVTPSTLYAGTDLGVFQSTNSGASWTAINNGFTDSYGYVKHVIALAIDPKTPRRLYAGTWGGGVFDIELACVVGAGTAASCTEAALDACLPGGADFNGAVTFACGPDPVTITVSSTKTISADTTIDGGNAVTVSGGNSVGVFSVNEGVNFTVENLTIANGARIQGDGGAINNDGTLIVTNCTFLRNVASSYGGTGIGGGAIFNSGALTVTNSTFSDNRAGSAYKGGSGGAIFNSGVLTVTTSTFSSNSANDAGGGAIDNFTPGTLSVANSTFWSNHALRTCWGQTAPCGYQPGSAISNSGAATVTNSTFSDNGIDAIDSSGTLTFTNSIIAGSPALMNCDGTITDGGHNLDSDGTCGVGPATDPLLDPDGLQDNGGPTDTIALLPDSPAIDAGDPEVCASAPVNGIDQRGYVRPGEGSTNCSIGAYEYAAPEPLVCNGDCNGDGEITVDEVITGVNIALGNVSVCSCMPCDTDANGAISIAELIKAVNFALTGCPFWHGEGAAVQGEAVMRIAAMRKRCQGREDVEVNQ
jgi:hypothetical protein